MPESKGRFRFKLEIEPLNGSEKITDHNGSDSHLEDTSFRAR